MPATKKGHGTVARRRPPRDEVEDAIDRANNRADRLRALAAGRGVRLPTIAREADELAGACRDLALLARERVRAAREAGKSAPARTGTR